MRGGGGWTSSRTERPPTLPPRSLVVSNFFFVDFETQFTQQLDEKAENSVELCPSSFTLTENCNLEDQKQIFFFFKKHGHYDVISQAGVFAQISTTGPLPDH